MRSRRLDCLHVIEERHQYSRACASKMLQKKELHVPSNSGALTFNLDAIDVELKNE